MKKQFTELIGAFCALIFFSLLTTSTAQGQYCPSTATSTAFEFVSEVSYDVYVNPSPRELYADNTADGSIGNILPGIESTIGVQVTGAWPGDNIYIYIDGDGDADFTVADLVGQASSITTENGSASPVDVSIPITVPLGSLPGETRLRVKMGDGVGNDPCEPTFTFGEVEDYLITISAGDCVPPSFTTTVVDDCETNTFNVQFTLTDPGSTNDVPNIGLIYAYNLGSDPDGDELVIPIPPIPGIPLTLFPNDLPFGETVSGEVRASTAGGDFNEDCYLTRNFAANDICPPPNDEPETAIPLVCGESLEGSSFTATETLPPLSTEICPLWIPSPLALDVWFSFDANGDDSYIIEAAVTDDAGTAFRVEVYTQNEEGTYDLFACPSNADQGVGFNELTTPEAGTYFVRIYTYTQFGISDWATYEISLDCFGPDICPDGGNPGDVCDTDTPLTVGEVVGDEAGCDCSEVSTDFELVCANGAIGSSYCYINNDNQAFRYASDNGNPVEISFDEGFLAFGDNVNIYAGTDNSGALMNPGETTGDFAGRSYTTADFGGSSSIYVELTSNAAESCELPTGLVIPPSTLVWNVACGESLGCVSPSLVITRVDEGGAPVEGCIPFGGSYFFTVATAGGEGNASYDVTVGAGEAFSLASGETSAVQGPFTQGTNTSVVATGAEIPACFASSNVQSPELCPPPNDECLEALPALCEQSYQGTTLGAGPIPEGILAVTAGSACGTSLTTGGVFYEWTAPFNSLVEFNTNGSAYDTKLHVFQTDDCLAYTCIAGNDDGGDGLQSLVNLSANQGETFLLYITGFSANAGSYNLNVVCTELFCSNPELTIVAQDLEGNALTECQNAGEQYQLAITIGALPDGDPNIDFTVTAGANSNDLVVPGQTIVLGPYSAGATVNVSALGNQDGQCSTSQAADNQLCLPSNDECDAPIALTVNPTLDCVDVTPGTNVGATASPQAEIDGAITGTPSQDVWFSFVAQNESHVISLLNVTAVIGFSTDMGMAVYDATSGCQALALIDDSDPNSFSVSGLVPGNDYVLRVYGWSTFSLAQTTFDVCVSTPPAPPSNDECAGAIALDVNEDLSCALTTPGSNASATESPEGELAGSITGTPTIDVWFSFVATNTSHTVGLQNVTAVIGTSTFMAFAVYDAGANGGSCLPEDQAVIVSTTSSGIVAEDLTVGNTYLVRVYNASTFSNAQTTFDVCVGTPSDEIPANDECLDAIGLTVNADLECGATTPGSTVNATESPQLEIDGAITGTPNNDVWFSFVASNSAHSISLLNITAPLGGSTDMGFAVYDGTGGCDALVLITSSDPNSATVTGLTPGTTYIVRVYGWSSSADFTAQTNFDVCVGTPPPPPANDTCDGAEAIACGDVVLGNTSTAFPELPSSVPADFCGTSISAPGVWYSITGDDSEITASLCGDATNYDSKIHVFAGTCGAVNCIGGNDDFCGLQSQLTFQALDGVQYFILVSGFSSNTGDFELALTCEPFAEPPVNDEAAGALPLTCDVAVSGSTDGATQSLAPSSGCGPFNETSSTALDIFYTFTADGATDYSITEGVSVGDYQVEVLSEDLQTAINCGPFFGGQSFELGTLDAGVYFVRVYGSDFFGGPLITDFDFTLNCTPVASGASIEGTVENWNNNCSDRGVTVTLYEPGSTIMVNEYSGTVLSDGSFSIADVDAGTFDVFVKLDAYLADGFPSVEILDGANDLSVPSVRLGDLNGDNVVNFFDGSAFNVALTPAPYDPLGDYNCDGAVNFFDVSALNPFINESGDNPPLSLPE